MKCIKPFDSVAQLIFLNNLYNNKTSSEVFFNTLSTNAKIILNYILSLRKGVALDLSKCKEDWFTKRPKYLLAMCLYWTYLIF